MFVHGTALVVSVREAEELSGALDSLGLEEARPALVVVGGAGGLRGPERERLRPLFEEALVPTVASLGGVIVDGGTDAGVMRLLGDAAARAGRGIPLIGVAAIGTVALPQAGEAPGAASLEPNHTHFVLVPGHQWGDESEWISLVATAVTGPRPSATVLVNGGETAWADVEMSVAAGRPVIIVDGSGRAADDIASALGPGTASDGRGDRLAASGLVEAVALDAGPSRLSDAIRARLGGA